VLQGESEKLLHVSPFFGMDQRYVWRASEPGTTLSVHMENREQGELAFDATLSRKRPGSSRLEAASRSVVLAAFGRMRSGSLAVAEAGWTRNFGGGDPRARIDVHSPAAWPLLVRGSRGLAESYARGLWDTPDLPGLIRVAARNAAQMDNFRRRVRPFVAPFLFATGTSRANGRRASRRQIAAHYDLGNDMFELMLDPTMTYSCTLFEREDMTLEEAAIAKLDRVCEQLDLQPDDHLLEIGTGWGGLAVHAARTRGCRVTTTTISREQREYAVKRIRDAALADRITVLLQDYRDLGGRFDKLVSIEMIEAVGWRNFGVFFRKCSELLQHNGTMLLQAITIDDRAYEIEKRARSFIRTYIFPNGCLPSLEVIRGCIARETDMRQLDAHELTASYVRTLREWRANFDAHTDELEQLGYDERFRRIWRLYLAYCEAGFTERRIGDWQLLFAKPGYESRRRDSSSVMRAQSATVS
jgi:cyclopropane-fatty-acyl-phospholipid synthase